MDRSISDDDLCSSCAFCLYRPGENSGCKKENASGWPGETDPDGYIVKCLAFVRITRPDENVVN